MFINFLLGSDAIYMSFVKVDGVSLQRVLGLVHSNSHNLIALLFYASWCSFSGSFRPTFSILSTVYPSIPHFAIEESVIKPRFGTTYILLCKFFFFGLLCHDMWD